MPNPNVAGFATLGWDSIAEGAPLLAFFEKWPHPTVVQRSLFDFRRQSPAWLQCRESPYKTLSAGAHPRFETINSVMHALGEKFAVVAERES